VSAPIRRPRGIRAAATGATGLVAVAALAVTMTSASASTLVHAQYKVTGSTDLKGPGFSLALGPGKLASTLNPKNGKLTATLTLPDATGSFKQAGVVPVTATTRFVNDGKTTGKLNLNTGAVSTTSKITLRIVSLTVAGLPVPVGKSCETKTPVVVNLKSQKNFNVLEGGNVAGSYTIPKFQHCLLATPLINLTIPASGNTITLKLGKAKVSKA
jgi:hypothetical protein